MTNSDRSNSILKSDEGDDQHNPEGFTAEERVLLSKHVLDYLTALLERTPQKETFEPETDKPQEGEEEQPPCKP